MKRYALFQHAQTALDVDALQEAFAACDGLTAHDGRTAAAHSNGVLMSKLTHEQASSLRRGLMQRGQHTEVVDKKWLALPKPVMCRRAVPSTEALTVYDTYGRAVPIAWNHVKAIAGGALVVGKTVKIKDMQGSYDEVYDEAEYAFQERDQLTVDIITTAPITRYRIESDRFDYSYLGARKRSKAGSNTALFVSDVVTLSLDTAVGLGVKQLISNARKTRRYRNAQQLDRELAWLLWRRFGPGSKLDGAVDYRREPFVPEGGVSSFADKARTHATRRLLQDNESKLAQHMEENRNVDIALAVLTGLVAASQAVDELAYTELSGGGYEFHPVRAVIIALLFFGFAAWGAFRGFREARRRKYWIG